MIRIVMLRAGGALDARLAAQLITSFEGMQDQDVLGDQPRFDPDCLSEQIRVRPRSDEAKFTAFDAVNQ
jgi:hypothetical protein